MASVLTEVSKFVQILCSDLREHRTTQEVEVDQDHQPSSAQISSGRSVKSAIHNVREASKCVGVAGLGGTEVSAVECRDFGHSESFSSCDDACGSFPKWEVGVLLNELRHALGVSGVEIDRDQFSRCE